jgi:hypothetical protein
MIGTRARVWTPSDDKRGEGDGLAMEVALAAVQKEVVVMARMELRVRVDQARENAIITMCKDGDPIGYIVLDAASLETHISIVAKQRGQMRDKVPRDPDPGSRLEVTIDAVWTTADDDPAVTGGNGKVLALRDPGFGWLAFFFPDKEAAAIAGWLTAA